MYSRNLAKNTVRASPDYSAVPKYSDLLSAQRSAAAESRYRYNIPPGYTGNRFSRNQPSEEPDTKHHPVPRKEAEWQDLPDVPQITEASEETDESTPNAEEHAPEESHPVPTDPLGSFISAVKDRVSGEDLLLIVIILMLALEGENAEITILLLSLLLLIK